MRPSFSWSMVRSRWAWLMSPLMAAAEKPRACSFCASSSVASLVRAKMIMPSNGSTSRMRVSASSLCRPETCQQRWRMFSAVRVLASIWISTGDFRYFCAMRLIAVGMVAENSATWRCSGDLRMMVSTSSMKPMRSISSASSSTRVFSSDRSSEFFSMWSMTRPGVPTTTCTPRRRADSCGP